MTLYDWKAFYRWLGEATDVELIARRDALVLFLERLTERAPRATVHRVVRDIEQELVAREVLKK